MASYDFIQNTGVIVPDTADLLSDVQTEFRTAFGQDLDVDPATPQGVLITAEVEARDAVARNNAELANQINPNLAGGKFLDAICALTGLERIRATRSTLSAVELTGVSGTIIPAGSRAETTNGDRFELVTSVVLDSAGEGVGEFRSVVFGPIAAPIGSLTQIVDNVLGWETVNNPSAAVLGQNEQSDQSLRALRRRTLALQGISLAEAIVSDLYDTEGVKSLQFRENFTDTDQVIDGIFLLKHSVWACVDGGTDEAVAQSLLENKSNGANWNGAVTVNTLEPASGQVYPVKFDRPTPVQILVRATVRQMDSTVDPQIAVRDAIMAYNDNTIDGETGFVVGQNVSPFELAGAINLQVPGIFVQKLEVAPFSGMPVWQTTEIAIALNEKAFTTASTIQVVVL